MSGVPASARSMADKAGVRLVVELGCDGSVIRRESGDQGVVFLDDARLDEFVADVARLLVRYELRELSVSRGAGAPVLRVFCDGKRVVAVVLASGARYAKSLARAVGRIFRGTREDRRA